MSKHKYQRADVVLVPFTFSDFSGGKARPAVIVSTTHFSTCQGDFILAAITGQVTAHAGHPCCHRLRDWKAAGLIKPSVATSHLITLSASSLGARLGKMSAPDLAKVEACLRRALGP